MRKKVLIIILIIFAISLIGLKNQDSEVRFRVIANSNSEEDQQIKREVYDKIMNFLNKKQINNLEKEIDRYIPDILKIVNETTLSKNNKVEFKNTTFPTKSLNGKVVAGGTYKTLLVTLGSGKGNNYWTLLYPDYYDFSYEKINSGEVEFKSYFYELFKKVFG